MTKEIPKISADAAKLESEQGRAQLWELDDLDQEMRQDLIKRDLEDMQLKMETEALKRESEKEEKENLGRLRSVFESPEECKNPEKLRSAFGELEALLAIETVLSKVTPLKEGGEKVEEFLERLQKRSKNKALFDLLSTVSANEDPEVREGYQNLLIEFCLNAEAAHMSAEVVTAEAQKREPKKPEWVSEKGGELWDGIKEFWGKSHPAVKVILGITAALAAYKIFSKLVDGLSNVSGSGLGKLLGLSAVIGGGGFAAWKLLGVDKIWDVYKATAGTLKIGKLEFIKAIRHIKAGEYTKAREVLGESADLIFEKMGISAEDEKGEGKEGDVEVDENGIRWVPAREALGAYTKPFKNAMKPFVSVVKQHQKELAVLGVIYGAHHLSMVMGGFEMTSKSCLAFSNLFVGGITHPLRSMMLISAFALASEIKVPEDPGQLHLFLQKYGDQFSAFLEEHGMGKIPEQHIKEVERIWKGLRDKLTLEDLGITAEKVASEVKEKILDALEITPEKKIRQENLIGLTAFHDYLDYSYDGEGQDVKELIGVVKRVMYAVRDGGQLTQRDIEGINFRAEKIGIMLLSQDNYVWWGKIDEDGAFLDPGHLQAIGISPALETQAEQFEAAKRFTIDPHSLLVGVSAMKVPIEQFQGGLHEFLETNGGWEKFSFILVNGLWSIFDGAKEKFLDMPIEFLLGIPSILESGFKGEMHCKEFLYSYAEGFLPVMAFGAATSLVRLENPLAGGVLNLIGDTVGYPVKGAITSTKFVGHYIAKPFLRGMGKGEGMGKISAG
ncbi:MAG: hypothetical protein Q8P95_00775, partial [bacterium]|nr:hypothetical protein [bacterium]